MGTSPAFVPHMRWKIGFMIDEPHLLLLCHVFLPKSVMRMGSCRGISGRGRWLFDTLALLLFRGNLCFFCCEFLKWDAMCVFLWPDVLKILSQWGQGKGRTPGVKKKGSLEGHWCAESQTDVTWLGPQRKAMKMHDIPKPVQIRNMDLEQKQRLNSGFLYWIYCLQWLKGSTELFL